MISWKFPHLDCRHVPPARIRVAGIRGLQGVVRKTVNDELQAIIWEPQHMDKLIPSMLFNMQEADDLDR